MADKTEPIIELELYLVRHGESYGNIPSDGTVKSVFDEHDPRLTPKGENQARLLGEFFSDFALDCVISSGLRRAVSTAQAVVQRQPEGAAHAVEVHPIFTECGVSREYEGRTFDEIKKDYLCAVPANGTEKYDKFIVNCEQPDTDASRLARAVEAIAYLRTRFVNGEKVLVAAHAAFNTFLYFAALGLSDSEIFDPGFYNTGVTKILFFKEGTGRFGCDVGLVYHNDHTHLAAEYPNAVFEEM